MCSGVFLMSRLPLRRGHGQLGLAWENGGTSTQLLMRGVMFSYVLCLGIFYSSPAVKHCLRKLEQVFVDFDWGKRF